MMVYQPLFQSYFCLVLLLLQSSCRNSCWSSWGSWSQCSVQCGHSGTRTRRRYVSPSYGCSYVIDDYGCPGSSFARTSCGRYCHNGGTLRSSHCSCPRGYRGTCCETSEFMYLAFGILEVQLYVGMGNPPPLFFGPAQTSPFHNYTLSFQDTEGHDCGSVQQADKVPKYQHSTKQAYYQSGALDKKKQRNQRSSTMFITYLYFATIKLINFRIALSLHIK